MDEDLFWKLIEKLEAAVVFAERQRGGDGWHYDQARVEVGFIKAELQEWLDGKGDDFDPIAPLRMMSLEDRERIIEATIRAPRLALPEPCLVELEVGENASVGAVLTKSEDGRLQLRRDEDWGIGLAGADLRAGQRARLDVSGITARWMPVEDAT